MLSVTLEKTLAQLLEFESDEIADQGSAIRGLEEEL
jgi:hypothetical protein